MKSRTSTGDANPLLIRGRGATSNASGRFEPISRGPLDPEFATEAPPDRLETTLTEERPRSIISHNDSPDLDFDQSINSYRGCEHGCIYCYARPTHAYMGLSPGLDFETKLFFKPNGAELLRQELKASGYRVRRIQLGANTDPYQPVEHRLTLTRDILEVLSEFGHPVGITTKGALVTRDIDILAPMAARKLAFVAISITTLDHKLARMMEPRASTSERRFDAIRQLSEAGIPVMVGVSPIILGLTDHEAEAILERAAAAGATGAYFSVLRLPREVKELFEGWLAANVPQRAKHVMSLVRQIRNGRDNDPRFGTRMTGEGPHAKLLADRFRIAKRRLGLTRRFSDLSLDEFRPVPGLGDQLTLI